MIQHQLNLSVKIAQDRKAGLRSHLLAGCQRLEQLQLSHCASVESLELSSTRLEEPWANTGTIHTESDVSLTYRHPHRFPTLHLCPPFPPPADPVTGPVDINGL